MSNNNSFGGKLKKILASMCSLFVGASGVSQAAKPGTSIPTKLKLSKDTNVFEFEGFSYKLASNDAKKENSWLFHGSGERYQLFRAGRIRFWTGFIWDEFLCGFCIWSENGLVSIVAIPKGILFDVMRHFERKYFPNDDDARDNGTKLSCVERPVKECVEGDVFLRFILWAFCGSPDAIDPKFSADVNELKAAIFDFAVKTGDFKNAGGEFVENFIGNKKKKCYVLRPGYFLENFNKCVHDVYEDLGCNMTNVNSMGCIDQLNEEIVQFNKGIARLSKEKETLENQKETLESQKHTSRCLLGVLGTFVGGGALIKGAHHLPGAKRSRSSEVNKGKTSINEVNKGKTSINKVNKGKSPINKVNKGKSPINKVNKGKPSINKVNKGKSPSNKKGGQKTKKNLKKQKS